MKSLTAILQDIAAGLTTSSNLLARLAYGMAVELARTRITTLCLSPGFLRSEAVLDILASGKKMARRDREGPFFAGSETPMLVGRAAAVLAADPDVGRKAGLIHFASDLAREYGFYGCRWSHPRLSADA